MVQWEMFVFSYVTSMEEFLDAYAGIKISSCYIYSCKGVTIFFYVYFAHLFFKDKFKLLFCIFKNRMLFL